MCGMISVNSIEKIKLKKLNDSWKHGLARYLGTAVIIIKGQAIHYYLSKSNLSKCLSVLS